MSTASSSHGDPATPYRTGHRGCKRWMVEKRSPPRVACLCPVGGDGEGNVAKWENDWVSSRRFAESTHWLYSRAGLCALTECYPHLLVGSGTPAHAAWNRLTWRVKLRSSGETKKRRSTGQTFLATVEKCEHFSRRNWSIVLIWFWSIGVDSLDEIKLLFLIVKLHDCIIVEKLIDR